MTYYFKCKDLGWNCSFENHAEKREDIFPRIRIHFHYAHATNDIDEETMAKIESVIYEGEEYKGEI